MEQKRPTLLLDEAQSIRRGGSESSQIIRELFNAGIDRHAVVIRCGGKKMNELQEFNIYSPKVIALIGDLDGVLADRCLLVEMKRKKSDEEVLNYRSRVVEPLGKTLYGELSAWADEKREKISKVYDTLEPFPIDNDRLAELLLPLQAVLIVAGGEKPVGILHDYAIHLDEESVKNMSVCTQLMSACRKIFEGNIEFMPTATLINTLKDRVEEPWHRYSNGETITAEALAKLLRAYGIRSTRVQKKILGKVKTTRGYFAKDFKDVCGRYV